MKKREQSLVQWARTEDFTDPPLWGEIESIILAEPLAQEELDLAKRTVGVGSRIIGGLVYLVVGVLIGLMYLSSLIGLALLLGRMNGNELVAQEWWIHGVRIAFLTAALVSGVTLGMWWETKRRGSVGPAVTAVTGVASLVAFALMLSQPELLGDVLALALAGLAGVLGMATCVVMLVSSKPGVPRRRLFGRRAQVTPEEQVRRGMRAQVLEILLKRGVVSEKEIDVSDMIEMPIGTWHELDPPRDARL